MYRNWRRGNETHSVLTEIKKIKNKKKREREICKLLFGFSCMKFYPEPLGFS